MAIKERGETPFDEAGDGIVLCFSYADCKKLDTEFKPGWMGIFVEDLGNGSIDFARLERVINVGMKKDEKPITAPIPVMPWNKLAERVVDALYVAMHGKTFTEFMADVEAKLAEAKAKGESPPLSPPGTIS